MDDKDFRKHLKDLAHGHHHPEEHDWAGETTAPAGTKRAPAKAAAKKKGKRPAARKR